MISYQLVHKDTIEKYKGEIARLNSLIAEATTFIDEVAHGNLDAQYHSDQEDNSLRKSLLAMKDHLSLIAQQEKNQAWMNRGLGVFAELLRTQHTGTEDLAYDFIKELIEYLNANQGGVFVEEEDERGKKVLQMKACYAYHRKKFIEKTVKIEQGLLGQAFQEKDTIHLTEIPDQYTFITSGLGEATPTSLLIVPIKYNEEVVGVLELASFHKFQPYQIEFVEKIAQNMAASISSMKINERTEKLLHETREQAESLQSQEEEMRQNLEELQATQEKSEAIERELRIQKETLEKELNAHAKESERLVQYLENYKKMLTELLDELPQKIFLKDAEGKFILVNTAVASAHNSSVEKLLNTSDFDYFSKEDATEYRMQELKIINGGKPTYFIHEETISGKTKILKTMKRPIYLKHLDQSGGLLGIQTDITEIKKLEDQLKEKDKELSELKKLLKL